MKSKDDLFSEKMPSDLKTRILAEAEIHLAHNRKTQRRTVLRWAFATGLASLAASFSFIYVRQNQLNQSHQIEVAQSVDFFEELQNDEDFEMIADYDLYENLDLLEQFDDDV